MQTAAIIRIRSSEFNELYSCYGCQNSIKVFITFFEEESVVKWCWVAFFVPKLWTLGHIHWSYL